jgi:hypothetical protein
MNFQKLWEYWIKIINTGLDIDFEIEGEDLREDSKDENSYTWKGMT